MSTITAPAFPLSPAPITVPDLDTLAPSVHTGGYSGTASDGGKVATLGREISGCRYIPAREIAAAIRRDIKALTAAGSLPGKAEGFVYSVRSDTYSGGQAVRIGVKYLGAEESRWGGHTDSWAQRPTTPADRDHDWRETVQREDVTALRTFLQRLSEQYTSRDVDSQTDYFNVSCYITVDLSWG